VRFRYYGFNNSAFSLLIDLLNITIYFPQTFEYTHTLNLLGTWKYRFSLDTGDPTEYNTTWVYFNVILPISNFEGISESEHATYWELIGSGVTEIEIFSDDMTAGTWDLIGGTDRSIYGFNESYLIDNTTTLTDAYDYNGFKFDAVEWSQVDGITYATDGHYYVVDKDPDRIFKYTAGGVYTGTWFDITAQTTNPISLGFSSNRFFILGTDTDKIYNYDYPGVYADEWTVAGECSDPTGVVGTEVGSTAGQFIWVVDYGDEVYKYGLGGTYELFSFDVSTHAGARDIAYDGTHFWILDDIDYYVYQYTVAGVATGINFYVGTEDVRPRGITFEPDFNDVFTVVGWRGYAYMYAEITDISKYYHGSGYAYMQTNITETLTFKRSAYGVSTTIYEEEFFKIELESTAPDILLNLYNGGILQDTLTVLSVNINPLRRVVGIYIPNDITFNQIEFIGTTMDDTEYFIVYDIKSVGYNVTDLLYGFYVDPDGQDYVMAQAGNYTLNIYDEVQEDKSMIFIETRNITLKSTYDLLTEFYIPILYWYLTIYHYSYEISTIELFGPENRTITDVLYDDINKFYLIEGDYIINWTNTQTNVTTYLVELFSDQILSLSVSYFDIYFSLYDQNRHKMDITLFSLEIDGAQRNFGFVTLYNKTYYNVMVFDWFNITIYNVNVTSITPNTAEYNIIITVFELQIRHLGVENSNLSISETTTHSFINFSMSPDSLTSYILADSVYNITWWNGENGVAIVHTITLNTNYILTLNSTYYTIYFGLFTYDGLGLDRDLVRFYIRDDGTEYERRDFGRNLVKSETADLLVLDYFNNTLASETIDASVYSEYNIYVEVYSLYILNQFTYYDLVFNITQVGSGYNMSQLIPSASALLYRFIPNLNYTINCTYVNGTVYNIRTINFTVNSQIESFGVANAPEEYPKDVYFGVYTTTGLGIDHDLLRFYIDGNRTDFGFNRIGDMIINITVMDFFNATLFTNPTFNTSGIYQYDILITLYSLKIKNEARVAANYTLSLGALETTGFILPQEIIEYQLATNNYVFDYMNNEDGSSDTININLNQDRVYILNSTYYNIYFSLFDLNLHTIDSDQYVFRLNGTREVLGFIEDLQTDDYTITITDRFGTSLFNSLVTLRGLNEYMINISLFELQVRHLAQVNSNLTLNETTMHTGLNFSMAPNTITSFILGSSTYNVTWINGENGAVITYDINLNTDYILTLNSTYYGVYFALLDQGGVRLDDSLFSLYINASRKDFGFVVLESDDVLIVVRDYLNFTVFNNVVTLTGISEYNINITIFELQIRHLARISGNVSIAETTTHNFINFSMSPDSLTSYMLADSVYNVTWWSGETNEAIVYVITLDENLILTLNSTYYITYFSLYDQGGVRLDDSLFSLYLNGTRKDFGFVELESDSTLIHVDDFLNFTVFNQVVSLSGVSEYNIIITVFELQIRHLARVNSNVSISETTGHNFINFSMSFDSLNKYMLADTTYNITWWNGENGAITVYGITLNENTILTLNSTYYNIYFSLFDLNLHTIDSDQYVFRLNGTREVLGFIEDLQTDDYTITITDRFGTSLFNSLVTLRGLNEYMINISLFELQVRHLAQVNSNLTLNETTMHTGLNFSMAPNTITSFILGSSTYNVTWINGENGAVITYDINLNTDYILTLNTTFYSVFFSLFTNDGLGISWDTVRFYINSVRKEFGPILLEHDINNITITDFFNETLFTDSVNTRVFTEYNIFVDIFTLNLFNNYSVPIIVEIERNDIEISCVIPAQSFFQYRFIPDIEYKISWYWENGTFIEHLDFELQDNGQIVSFGFFSTEITPTAITPQINWILVVVIIVLVVAVLFIYLNKKEVDESRNVPKSTTKRYNQKKRGYDNRL
ncbi:hypothetical protein LCGC14_0664660, partial [marine sediment metagenome]